MLQVRLQNSYVCCTFSWRAGGASINLYCDNWRLPKKASWFLWQMWKTVILTWSFFSALLFYSSKQADPYFLPEEREEILSISRVERVLFFSIHSESENSGRHNAFDNELLTNQHLLLTLKMIQNYSFWNFWQFVLQSNQTYSITVIYVRIQKTLHTDLHTDSAAQQLIQKKC